MKICFTQKDTNTRAGFGLTESLIGVVIMGMVFVALYSGMATGFHSVRSARENLRATQILMEKFEAVRLYNWEQITTPGFVPTTFTNVFAPSQAVRGTLYVGTVTINPAPVTEVYSNDMRHVTIQLSWNSNGSTKTRSFTSFVARYGLQHYIY